MSQPTHYFVDASGEASIVSPDGYEGLAVELPKGFWDTPKVWNGKAWAEDIEGERARLWAEVKARRDAITFGGCDTPSGRVDTDAKSISAIDSMAGAAANNPAFTTNWTLADNTRAPVDAAAMLEIKAAVAAHVNAVRDASNALRDAIYRSAVTSIKELRELVSNPMDGLK